MVKFPLVGKNTKNPDPAEDPHQPNEANDLVEAKDLPIALYLNQRLTFDLLAALKGGVLQF